MFASSFFVIWISVSIFVRILIIYTFNDKIVKAIPHKDRILGVYYMKLQNLIFPKTGICTEEKLYFRSDGDTRLIQEKNRLETESDTIISFDTYFNGCTVEKWHKYTNVKKISIVLRVCGRFRITLMRKERTEDGIASETLGRHIFGSDGKEGVYTFPFESSSDKGIYSFKLSCLSDKGTIFEGWYEGETAPEDIRRVKIAIDICTFKREEFVLRNVKEMYDTFLSDPGSGMSDNLEIFISDNAKTLSRSETELCDKIHVFGNRNTGGAGGFTRGMIEIMKCRSERNITHVLVMDDDIIINPDSVYRTFVLLSLLRDEYKDAFVGGAMLRLDNQNIQTENGAKWNMGELISYKSGLDLNRPEACLFNEKEEETEYNAWWYCAFPADVVSESNLPLPIFIRGDDVEYGLRNMKHLILMNGICVWHEPFENKYSSSMYYYIFRNRLIDNSIHSLPYTRKMFIKNLTSQVKRELVFYRYKNARLLLDGANDYFRGVDWLMKQDGEALHKDIIGRGYRLLDIKELGVPFDHDEYVRASKLPEPGRKQRMWRKATANGIILPCKRKKKTDMPSIAPTFAARPVHFYRAHRVLHYDDCSGKGFVTVKSSMKTLGMMLRLWSLSLKARFRYRKTAKSYSERGRELMALSFWKKYLDIE